MNLVRERVQIDGDLTTRGEQRSGDLTPRPFRFPSLASAAWCLFVLASCVESDDLRDGSRATRRIAADTVTAIGEGTATSLVVAEEPDITIGEVDGEGPYNLTGVTGAIRLSDQTIVVADCASRELRYFDSAGRYLRSVGGPGDGPGEFTWLRRIFRLGTDTVAAFDTYKGRITVFAPDGKVARIVTVPLAPLMLDVLGRLSDGPFVARRFAWGTPPENGTVYRGEARLLLLDATGEPLDSISGLPGGEYLVPPGPNGPYITPNFAQAISVAVRGSHIFYGAQDDTGIITFDARLSPVGLTGTTTREAPVTEELRALVEDLTDEQAYSLRLSRHGEFTRMMPAFRDFVAGRDGRLWVQDPERLDGLPLRWTAYAGGRVVSRVELPVRFFPFEFGPHWVLGVAFDEWDIQRVVLWRLVPGPFSVGTVPLQDGYPPKSSCTWQASR